MILKTKKNTFLDYLGSSYLLFYAKS